LIDARVESGIDFTPNLLPAIFRCKLPQFFRKLPYHVPTTRAAQIISDKLGVYRRLARVPGVALAYFSLKLFAFAVVGGRQRLGNALAFLITPLVVECGPIKREAYRFGDGPLVPYHMSGDEREQVSEGIFLRPSHFH